jgi:hypothetical protein
MPAQTFSFLDVNASITGPGGNFSLGSGAGAAQEGITITMAEEKGKVDVGADGSIMNTLRASDLGRVSVRLLKTSPVNAQLNGMYNFQKASSGRWGQNVIVVSDTQRGDRTTITAVQFMKQPDLSYAQDPGHNEWIFSGKVTELLGTGTPIAD